MNESNTFSQMTPRAAQAPARGLKFETRQLCRAVGNKRLVDDVSVAVEPGEVLAVVGASGAGKSSFLRLLNRLDEPTGGTVMVDGADYRTIAPPQSTLRSYFAMLVHVSRWHLVGVIAVAVLFSLTESIGIALLLPTLQVAGFNLG